jgi:hypothetical protein
MRGGDWPHQATLTNHQPAAKSPKISEKPIQETAAAQALPKVKSEFSNAAL